MLITDVLPQPTCLIMMLYLVMLFLSNNNNDVVTPGPCRARNASDPHDQHWKSGLLGYQGASGHLTAGFSQAQAHGPSPGQFS